MVAFPYDVKFTVTGGSAYGFMLVTPKDQTKQIGADEVESPPVGRGEPSMQDFTEKSDTPFSMATYIDGVGKLESDEQSESGYWWGSGVVTHVDGKAYLAPPAQGPLALTSGTTAVAGFYTYVTSAGVRYDFAWSDKYLWRRPATDSTTAWTLVYTQPDSKPITDFVVFNGVGCIAVPTLTDAIGGDFYTQADPTAAATWTPTLRNHTAFSNTNGRPKRLLPVRGTLYALVDNAKVYYTVDPTSDSWAGPIVATVSSITNPDVGESTYKFTNVFAVNDYLFTFKWDSGHNIDGEQNVTEVLWQWKSKPSDENFKYVCAGGADALLYYSVSTEIYSYDPSSGQHLPLKLARQSGYSIQSILGLDADNQYVYVLAQVRVPTLRSAASIVLLRGFHKTGSRWVFECIWEDTSIGTKLYSCLKACPYGAATRLYWGYQSASGAASQTYVMEIPADWDESTGSSFATSGYLYTSVSRSLFPGIAKRMLAFRMQTENTTSSANKIDVSYSLDNGASFTSLGGTGSGGSGSLSTELSYSNATARSIVLRFQFTGNGSVTPILRTFVHHQRARFKYLPSVMASLRVGDYIERLNGTKDTKTAVTLRSDLETLRTTDGEILYEDYLGNSFYCSIDRFTYKASRHENPVNKGEVEATVIVSRADKGA